MPAAPIIKQKAKCACYDKIALSSDESEAESETEEQPVDPPIDIGNPIEEGELDEMKQDLETLT